MAKNNILDVILKTITDVQQKNRNNPREETAHPNVFDLIKQKIGELDVKHQTKQAEKGKNPASILDLIRNQIEAARQHNRQDPNTPTAPDSVFDKLIRKVEERPKRAASVGIRKIIEDYRLDVSRVPRQTLQQIQQQYDADLRKMRDHYAKAIHDLTQRM